VHHSLGQSACCGTIKLSFIRDLKRQYRSADLEIVVRERLAGHPEVKGILH
jgi:hypothetical protein